MWNKKIIVLSVLVLIPFFGFSQKDKKSSSTKIEIKNELDSVSYSLGIAIGQTLKSAGIQEINEKLFNLAISDVLSGKETLISSQQTNNIIQAYVMKMRGELAKRNLEEGRKFLAENSKKEGIVTLPSGLQYKIIKEGSGDSPTIKDKVTCHYQGSLINGKVFDSSYERGEPVQFPLNGVIQGWTEALQLMKPGAKWILYIPSELAYGEQNVPGIEPNSVLIFEVELLSVEKGSEETTQPE